ncbi:DUF2087 domain-containing protein [Streptomyces sp. XM4193]|uniref:DUF2087 domain-containing protein n=1 Tax=Streptomyces sp. XM4193 TaxID=2929782 RepID=UPI001FFA2C8C|nr:DUF2087 domain-containing protein [Streptomyces sp. XM4193]MCK1798625.1 DUF2087 domain-containing protein [Streptomyces sp. XM4193]
MSTTPPPAAPPVDPSAGPLSDSPAAPLANHFRDGRLVNIPRKQARRAALLDHLARTLFAPDREYAEQAVNDALSTVHDDHAALRRYLVEGGLLVRTRDGSSYRRATDGRTG